jgi:hypothetical protein
VPPVTPQALGDLRVRLAGLVFVAALALLVAAGAGALRVGAVDAVPDSALRFAAAGTGTDVAAANARDLFTDDRRAPARRYLMPGMADTPQAGPAPLPTVLGTALGSDGAHFAIAQLPGGLATIIRVNGKIGEYTVVAIERARVTLRGPDGIRLTVDASKP